MKRRFIYELKNQHKALRHWLEHPKFTKKLQSCRLTHSITFIQIGHTLCHVNSYSKLPSLCVKVLKHVWNPEKSKKAFKILFEFLTERVDKEWELDDKITTLTFAVKNNKVLVFKDKVFPRLSAKTSTTGDLSTDDSADEHEITCRHGKFTRMAHFRQEHKIFRQQKLIAVAQKRASKSEKCDDEHKHRKRSNIERSNHPCYEGTQTKHNNKAIQEEIQAKKIKICEKRQKTAEKNVLCDVQDKNSKTPRTVASCRKGQRQETVEHLVTKSSYEKNSDKEKSGDENSGDEKYEEISSHNDIRYDENSEDENSGDENSGDENNGDENSGDENSGDENSGDENSGDENSGDENNGDDNSGDDNSGDDNSGDDNSGDENSGDENNGDENSGDENSGDENNGDENSGDENSRDDNSGDEKCEEISSHNDIRYDENSGDENSGDENNGDENSGDENNGDENSGDENSRDDNSGDENSGDENSGDENSGDENSGDENSGDENNGDDNSGDNNSGDDNSGDDNSGDDNSGDDNSGDDNSGDDNSEDENSGDEDIGDENNGDENSEGEKYDEISSHKNTRYDDNSGDDNSGNENSGDENSEDEKCEEINWHDDTRIDVNSQDMNSQSGKKSNDDDRSGQRTNEKDSRHGDENIQIPYCEFEMHQQLIPLRHWINDSKFYSNLMKPNSSFLSPYAVTFIQCERTLCHVSSYPCFTSVIKCKVAAQIHDEKSEETFRLDMYKELSEYLKSWAATDPKCGTRKLSFAVGSKVVYVMENQANLCTDSEAERSKISTGDRTDVSDNDCERGLKLCCIHGSDLSVREFRQTHSEIYLHAKKRHAADKKEQERDRGDEGAYIRLDIFQSQSTSQLYDETSESDDSCSNKEQTQNVMKTNNNAQDKENQKTCRTILNRNLKEHGYLLSIDFLRNIIIYGKICNQETYITDPELKDLHQIFEKFILNIVESWNVYKTCSTTKEYKENLDYLRNKMNSVDSSLQQISVLFDFLFPKLIIREEENSREAEKDKEINRNVEDSKNCVLRNMECFIKHGYDRALEDSKQIINTFFPNESEDGSKEEEEVDLEVNRKLKERSKRDNGEEGDNHNQNNIKENSHNSHNENNFGENSRYDVSEVENNENTHSVKVSPEDWLSRKQKKREILAEHGICSTELMLKILRRYPYLFHWKNPNCFYSGDYVGGDGMNLVMQLLVDRNLVEKKTPEYKKLKISLQAFSKSPRFYVHAMKHGGFPKQLRDLQKKSCYWRCRRDDREMEFCPDSRKQSRACK